MQPKTINIDTKEFRALEVANSALRFKHGDKYEFLIREVYFDFGQDWTWTTITCHYGSDSYQILSPKDWELILTAETAQEIVNIVDKLEIVYDKYNQRGI